MSVVARTFTAASLVMTVTGIALLGMKSYSASSNVLVAGMIVGFMAIPFAVVDLRRKLGWARAVKALKEAREVQ